MRMIKLTERRKWARNDDNAWHYSNRESISSKFRRVMIFMYHHQYNSEHYLFSGTITPRILFRNLGRQFCKQNTRTILAVIHNSNNSGTLFLNIQFYQRNFLICEIVLTDTHMNNIQMKIYSENTPYFPLGWPYI